MIADPVEAFGAPLKPDCHCSLKPKPTGGLGGSLVANIPLIPILIAFVLKDNLRRALFLSNGEAGSLFSLPVTLTF